MADRRRGIDRRRVLHNFRLSRGRRAEDAHGHLDRLATVASYYQNLDLEGGLALVRAYVEDLETELALKAAAEQQRGATYRTRQTAEQRRANARKAARIRWAAKDPCA